MTNFQILNFLKRFGTLIGFVLIVLYFWYERPETFMSIRNWLNITQQISILGVVAFTMTVVMVVGDFDLSVGSMASLAGIVLATQFEDGRSIEYAVALALMVGILGGLFNGILVSYVGISAFVATLGTLTMFAGLALYISGGTTIFGKVIPVEFAEWGRGGIALGTVDKVDVQFHNLSVVASVVFIIVLIVLTQTVYGRRLYAIGGNKEAARLGGVQVRFLRLTAFIISGLGGSIAGVMLVSRLASANPTQGDGYMLDAIASVFLGMTLSEEGVPNVWGTLLGIFILGVLTNGLTQLRIDSYIQQILTGGIIILAVMLSSLSRRTA